MTAQEHEIALKIVRELDRSTHSIGNDTVAKLANAREQALAHYQQIPTMGMAAAGPFGTQKLERPASGIRYSLSLAVLILGLTGIVYWQSSNGTGSEIADLDARLLTDDLPIDAYLDKGFDSWLKRQQR